MRIMEARMAMVKWDPVPDMIGWNRLKSLRKERGLSQPEVAVGAGVSITQIYFLELGYDNRTTAKTKQKVAGFFDVDVDDLFPCEMIGNVPRDVFIEKAKKKTGQSKAK